MAAQNFASRYDDFLSLLPTRGFRLYNSKENKKPVIALVQKTAMIFTVFMMTEDVRVKCGTFS